VIEEIAQPGTSSACSATSTAGASGFEVNELCQVLGVSRSGFYAHRHKDQRLRQREDRVLVGHIRSAFEEGQETYGSLRLVRELKKRGVRTSKTRVRRLMQSEGICPIQQRRVRVCTTRSNPHLPVAPHLLLEAAPPTRPGERFYSDITYIPTQEGWRRPTGTRLAATLDGYSRKCAGWSAADNMETPLVLRAAQRAFAQAAHARVTADIDVESTIHHSDRGSQYASEWFRGFLQQHGVEQSMSRKGNCYDNALMESFWATLKTECFDNFRDGKPATRQDAKQRLFAYIEVFYNRKRLHSSLDYRSPLEFEASYRQRNLLKEESTSLPVSTLSRKHQTGQERQI
jgi:putative transposase